MSAANPIPAAATDFDLPRLSRRSDTARSNSSPCRHNESAILCLRSVDTAFRSVHVPPYLVGRRSLLQETSFPLQPPDGPSKPSACSELLQTAGSIPQLSFW